MKFAKTGKFFPTGFVNFFISIPFSPSNRLLITRYLRKQYETRLRSFFLLHVRIVKYYTKPYTRWPEVNKEISRWKSYTGVVRSYLVKLHLPDNIFDPYQ